MKNLYQGLFTSPTGGEIVIGMDAKTFLTLVTLKLTVPFLPLCQVIFAACTETQENVLPPLWNWQEMASNLVCTFEKDGLGVSVHVQCLETLRATQRHNA